MGNLPVPIVEVLHDEQPLVGLLGVGHQVALGSPVQVLVLQHPRDELLFGHLNLLGGGPNVGAVPGGDKGIEILHLGFCSFHFAFQPHPLTAFLQHVRCDLVDDVRLVHQLIQEIVGHVAAGLANTGQHFFKDPVFKLLCGGQLAVDDQPVQISFGNVGQALDTARSKGVAFRDTLAMPLQSSSGVGIAEGSCRVAGTETYSDEELLTLLVNNDLGSGSFGKTVVLQDPFIDELFVAKKYEPYYEDDRKAFYDSFLQEIKIMHKLNHQNVVRIYNYYAYQFSKVVLTACPRLKKTGAV